MARIRTIKPDFWTDGTIIGLSAMARLFYIGTWNFSLCDRGHLPDDAIGLKLKILPADDVDPYALIGELLSTGRLIRRRSGGRTYLYNPRLGEHQKTDARWQSRCPYCASEEAGGFEEDSPTLPEPPPSTPEPPETHPSSPQGSKGKDGIGKEVQRAARAADGASAAAAPESLTETQRSKRITDAYHHAEPMSRWPAVNAIVIKAIKAKRWSDEEIQSALLRMARENRPVTVDSLRVELAGLPPSRASPHLVEVNGMKLRPETAARFADRERFAAKDAEEARLAIEGGS